MGVWEQSSELCSGVVDISESAMGGQSTSEISFIYFIYFIGFIGHIKINTKYKTEIQKTKWVVQRISRKMGQRDQCKAQPLKHY